MALKLAIYDMPPAVGRRLSSAFSSSGHTVLFEGILNERNARNDADVWVTKWSFGLDGSFLSRFRPKAGIISATSGVDHIDRASLSRYGLRAERCPTFSSRSVAEHALALAFRAVYSGCSLPPIRQGKVLISNFSDAYAEQAIAHILMRNRQIDESVSLARKYAYHDCDGMRPDWPWENRELSGSRIGLIGRGGPAFLLAHMLKSGFDCEIWGHDVPENMAAFNVRLARLDEILDKCEYIFLTGSNRIDAPGLPEPVPASRLELPESTLHKSIVSVIGTGSIGSIISRICKHGFDCEVRAFSRSMRRDLIDIGVTYPDFESGSALGSTLSGSCFIFVAVALDGRTSGLLPGSADGWLKSGRRPILVNITRDKVIDNDSMLQLLLSRRISAYATDVVPGDFILCKGDPQLPPHTDIFMSNPFVIPTPHVAECSRESLERLVFEMTDKANAFLR